MTRALRRTVRYVVMLFLVCIALFATGLRPASALEPKVRAGALSFRSASFKALEVTDSLLPFYRTAPTPKTSGDASMVIMRVVDGRAYDMALRQAEWGYRYLKSYPFGNDPWYLTRAEAQANRLIVCHKTAGAGWFYPSTFKYWLAHPYGGTLVPPWYSGIAQGAAVGFFARLWVATGDAKYKDAADHTFESFLVPRTSHGLWVSRVDSAGYLRLEEYPVSTWEFIFNGHMEAAMGLYDYYRVTHDARALAMYQGALTTVVHYGETFRNRGQVSAYSLGARMQSAHYHAQHVWQLNQLFALSGDRRFIRLADEFYDDYVASGPGTMRVRPGTYTAYRFSSSGRITAKRTVRIRSAVDYRMSGRDRSGGRSGYWLKIQGGSLSGYSLQETPRRVYCLGATARMSYAVPVAMTLRRGRLTGHTFDARGAATSTRSITVTASQTATVGMRAVVNGMPQVLLTSGPLAGYWVLQTAVVLP
jgi:hypothetical protein